VGLPFTDTHRVGWLSSGDSFEFGEGSSPTEFLVRWANVFGHVVKSPGALGSLGFFDDHGELVCFFL